MSIVLVPDSTVWD